MTYKRWGGGVSTPFHAAIEVKISLKNMVI